MKNILVPISLWDTTEKVLGHAVHLAAACGSTVWLLHVIEIPAYLSQWPKELREQRENEMQALRRELQGRADEIARRGVAAKALVVEGIDVVEAILKQAAQMEADLIVMGSHGRGGLYGALLGDVARDVLHRASCPVLVVPMRIARSPAAG